MTYSSTATKGEEVHVTDVIAAAQRIIKERISELEREGSDLKQALQALDGRQRGGGRGRTKPRRRTASRDQADREPGKRQQQFLTTVKKSPGARASDVAKAIGIAPQQAYGIARSLQRQGRIRRRGKGYALKG
jgi:DNA invertase Pin-like site-specific DNA recombinase